jgi:hypothetical protein
MVWAMMARGERTRNPSRLRDKSRRATGVMRRLGERTARNAEPVDPAIRTTHFGSKHCQMRDFDRDLIREGMASGHVNRIKRPNTWLHRPMPQNLKKALANPEPSGSQASRRTDQILFAE